MFHSCFSAHKKYALTGPLLKGLEEQAMTSLALFPKGPKAQAMVSPLRITSVGFTGLISSGPTDTSYDFTGTASEGPRGKG